MTELILKDIIILSLLVQTLLYSNLQTVQMRIIFELYICIKRLRSEVFRIAFSVFQTHFRLSLLLF